MKFCNEPYDTISIVNNGNVYSCLCGNWNKFGEIGNLFHNSLNEIYSSGSLQSFRNTILDQSFKFCNPITCGKLWTLPIINEIPCLNPTLPSIIMLSIDSNCNLQCKSCRNQLTYSKNIDANTHKILQNLKSSYQSHNEKVTIYCDGSGDIFVSEAYKQFFVEDLPDCFEFALTTNGNLLLKNFHILQKLKNQIDSIVVSLDAANKDTYKQVRGGDFNIVIDGIKKSLDLGINVSTQFVVQKNNYKELLDYKELTTRLGIKQIGYQLIRYWPHMNLTWWNENKILDNLTIEFDFLKLSLLELSKDNDVNLCGGLLSIIQEDLQHESTSVILPPPHTR